MNTTLPTDSQARKEIPIVSGCLDYFPAALAGVARVSKQGNDKHNPGQPLHHARGKSTDHADCIVRHLIDLQGLLAEMSRTPYPDGVPQIALDEVSRLAWRALALSQELHERFGAPLAPAARLPGAGPNNRFEVATPGEIDAIAANAPFILTPDVVPPLQLEVGKRYVRRNGKVSGPIKFRGDELRRYPWRDCLEFYTHAGNYWSDGTPDPLDLIREYREDERTAEQAVADQE